MLIDRVSQAASYLKNGLSSVPPAARASDGSVEPAGSLREKFGALAAGAGRSGAATVSIVIPVHYLEGEDKIAAALSSLAGSRTSAKVEVLLVVNGKAKVDELAKSPAAVFAGRAGLKVLFKTYLEDGLQSIGRPRNIFVPRQVGLEAAKGSVVIQGDADNIFSPRWIDSYVRFFGEHPDTPVAYGPVVYYSMRGLFGHLMALTGTAAKAAKILIGYPPCAGHNHALLRSAALAVPSLYSERIRDHENEIPGILQKELSKARVDDVVGYCPGSMVATRFDKTDQSFRGAVRWFFMRIAQNLRQIRR